jgi:hypothetical protein
LGGLVQGPFGAVRDVSSWHFSDLPRCRSHSVEEKATSSHGEWLAWEEPRTVGDLVHVEKFFARNLGGLIHARARVPGRLGKATSRTPSMYVDEKSDEAVVPAKRLNKGR